MAHRVKTAARAAAKPRRPSEGDERIARLEQSTRRVQRVSKVQRGLLTRYLAGGLVDVDRVAADFGITKASLAQSLGLAEETLQRAARVSAPRTQQRLREMLEILTRVEPWAGGLVQAMGWYRGQGIPALGDQTAEALVRTDQAGIVRAYLDGLAAGAYA